MCFLLNLLGTRDWCLIYVYEIKIFKKAMARVGRRDCIKSKQCSPVKKACVDAPGLGVGVFSYHSASKELLLEVSLGNAQRSPAMCPMCYKLTIQVTTTGLHLCWSNNIALVSYIYSLSPPPPLLTEDVSETEARNLGCEGRRDEFRKEMLTIPLFL